LIFVVQTSSGSSFPSLGVACVLIGERVGARESIAG